MAYGMIQMDEIDHEDALATLLDMGRRLDASAAVTDDTDERTYLARIAGEIATLAARMSAEGAGRKGYSESDIKLLRSVVCGTDRTRAALQAWAEAKKAGHREARSLEDNVDRLAALRDRLDQPFIANTSQDAHDEDDAQDTDD
jgi:hypothetical protein